MNAMKQLPYPHQSTAVLREVSLVLEAVAVAVLEAEAGQDGRHRANWLVTAAGSGTSAV